MIGIHVSKGTADGWFGQGKTSAILSLAAIVTLIMGISFGIFAAMSASGKTNISQSAAPLAPAAPTPTEPASAPETLAVKPEVIPETKSEILSQAGVVDTVTFIKGFLDERYKRGEQINITGVVTEIEESLPAGAIDYRSLVVKVTLGPIYTASDGSQYVIIAQFPETEYTLAKKLSEKLEVLKDKKVIINGVMRYVSPGYRTKIFLSDCTLEEAP